VSALDAPFCAVCGAALLGHAAGLVPGMLPLCPEHDLPDVDDEAPLYPEGDRMGLFARSLRPGFSPAINWVGPRFHLSMKAAIGLWCLKRLRLTLSWLIHHPRATVLSAGLGWAYLRYGVWPVAVAGVVAGVGVAVWAKVSPRSFGRLVRYPLRARRRRFWVYRREWEPAMRTTGLIIVSGKAWFVPKLGRVRSTAETDVVRVKMVSGQTVEQWAKAAPALAQSFSVQDMRVYGVEDKPQLVELWAMVKDPLRKPVAPPEPVTIPARLASVPCGRREDGQPLRLNLLYTHLLIAGATRAGKSSAVWALLCGIAPLIRDGWVKVLAIDPKGGMELAPGRHLFHRFAYGEPTDNGRAWQEDMVKLLEHAVRWLQRRAARYREDDGKKGTRKWHPTKEDPLIVVLIDEVLALLSFVTDPALRKRAQAALGILATQGAAVGFSVWVASQNPRKEELGSLRDYLATRIGLRTVGADDADMILGRGARDRGARTDQIPVKRPGVAYVVIDGRPDPMRVRFAHIHDQDIARTAREYRPVQDDRPRQEQAA
jgi:S-DNA-T family DNA segregation ATPase FtsK/SpoIIIE